MLLDAADSVFRSAASPLSWLAVEKTVQRVRKRRHGMRALDTHLPAYFKKKKEPKRVRDLICVCR